MRIEDCGSEIIVTFECLSFDDGSEDSAGLYRAMLTQDRLYALADSWVGRTVRVDLRDVKQLGSYSVSTLLGVRSRLRKTEGRLVLANVSVTILGFLRLTNLDRVL